MRIVVVSQTGQQLDEVETDQPELLLEAARMYPQAKPGLRDDARVAVTRLLGQVSSGPQADRGRGVERSACLFRQTRPGRSCTVATSPRKASEKIRCSTLGKPAGGRAA